MQLPATRARFSRVAALIAALAILIVPASTSASAVSASAVRVKLGYPSHILRLNEHFKLTATITAHGRRLSGKARYRFLYGGAPVNTAPWQRFHHGRTSFDLYPTTKTASAGVGVTLTLQVQVRTRSGSGSASTKVTIRS